MNKFNKKTLAKATAALQAVAKRFGSVPLGPDERWHSMYPERIATPFGPLLIHVSPGQYGLAVFGRFTAENLAEVARFVDCNPYSGKWNQHYFPGTDVSDMVLDLTYRLKKVTGREPTNG